MLPIVTVSDARVVNDPELRFAASGVAVGSFRIVASHVKRNEDDTGWVDDKVLWLPVTCFKQLAENVAESLRKGDLVSVTGRLQTDEWETDGEKRSRTVLIADSVAASLKFRTIRHSGEGQTTRSSTPDANDPWAGASQGGSDEPPF